MVCVFLDACSMGVRKGRGAGVHEGAGAFACTFYRVQPHTTHETNWLLSESPCHMPSFIIMPLACPQIQSCYSSGVWRC